MYTRPSSITDDSSQIVFENIRQVDPHPGASAEVPRIMPALEKYQLSDGESEDFRKKSEAESRTRGDGTCTADNVSKEKTTDIPCDSTIRALSRSLSLSWAAENTSIFTSSGLFKRPYGDDIYDDIVHKRARQKNLDMKLESFSGIPSISMSLNEKPASELKEKIATAELDDTAGSLAAKSFTSPLLASNSLDEAPSPYQHSQFSFCHEYYGNDHLSLETDPLEDFHSPFSDYSHRRLVPIGPSHQADIPELRSCLALKNGASCVDLGVYVGSTDKWLGVSIIAMSDLGSMVMESQSCCSLNECDCPDEGSMRCVRQHVMEARESFKWTLGHEKLFELGFCDMGEVVAEKWTKDEEILFQKVVLLNPASLGRNFWPVLSRAFPSRSWKELVSYYFNFFVLRKRAEQNRFDPLNVDSDNDEWQETNYGVLAMSEEEEEEEDGEDSVVESPVDGDDDVGNKTYLLEQGDTNDEVDDEDDYNDEDNGFYGGSDDFRGFGLKAKKTNQPTHKYSTDGAQDEDVQDDSCTSYEGQFNVNDSCHVHADNFGAQSKSDGINCIADDEYAKGCHDSKLWEINYVGAAEKDIEFSPTCHVIEEVFGKESGDKDAGDAL